MEAKRIPVLIGDIGGSNSRLSLVHMTKNPGDEIVVIDEGNLTSFQYDSMGSLLKAYLVKYMETENYPKIAILGIAAPVFNNSFSTIANLPWTQTRGDDLAKDLGMQKIVLLNDFVVNGYGLLTSIQEGVDYSRLNNNPVDPNGVIAMIGAGTGLGHGYLTKPPGAKYHEVFPSEGGHQDFAPQTDLQWKYAKYLQKAYDIDHVSVERACSGPAIPVMYKFLQEEEKITAGDEDLQKIMEAIDIKNSDELIKINPIITKTGLDNKCKVCERVVEFLVEIYGAAAGNIALNVLPKGGLFLLGGLSIGLENYLINNPTFWKNFISKGRLKKIVEGIPIFIVKNSRIGVSGAQEYARRVLEALDL